MNQSARGGFSRLKRLASRLLRRRGEPLFVVFFFALPDPLPFPDGAIYSFTHADHRVAGLEGHHMAQYVHGPMVEWSGDLISSLRFWRTPAESELWTEQFDAPFRVIERVAPELAPEKQEGEFKAAEEQRQAAELGTYMTVVEAVTVLLMDAEDPMTDAFERCFELLDGIVDAHRLQSRELIGSLARQRLAPMIPYATRPVTGTPDWNDLGIFLLHANVGPVGPEELQQHEIELFNIFFETVSRGHPFALYSDRSLAARFALEREGRFGDAVIAAQTSMEVLLDALLALMLWEEGKRPEDAAAAEFADVGFERRVRSHFHGRLGGDWRTKGGGVMTEWASDVAHMRGRVVHAGYRPTPEETRRALDVATRVEEFVRQRVIERRNVYPRTALLLVGRPGLERAGVWGGKIRQFAERSADEPDWIASFSSWREVLDRERSV